MTPKQKRFVEEYLIDLNATQAAIRAGYSVATAEQQGCRLLRNVQIAAAVQEALQKRSERTQITADRVLQELAILGFSDMGDYVRLTQDGGVMLDFSALPENGTRVIQEITQDVYTERVRNDETGDYESTPVKRTKFKLYDKRAALVDIGKHLGMFTDVVEHRGDAFAALVTALDGSSRDLPAANGHDTANGRANGHSQSSD